MRQIAQVTKYYYPHQGGIENHVRDITREIAKKEGVTIITSNPGTHNGAKVYRSTPWFTKFSTPFIPGIFINLLVTDYDIIHFHHPDPFTSIFVYLASIIKGKPIVVTYHADIVNKPGMNIYNIFLNHLLKKSRKIIATTPDYITKSPILRKYAKKTVVIPNPVDTKEFCPGETDIKQKLGIKKEMVLFLGRLVPYKGVHYLIHAFSQLGSDATLVIAGKGPLREELELELKNTPSDVTIRLIDPDDYGVKELYQAADLFVLPSITNAEAFGITLLEAQSCGTPTIGTTVGGVPYVIGDPEFIIEPKDTTKLALAMKKLLEDPELRLKKGKENRERMVREFDTKHVALMIQFVYDSITSNNG